MTEDLKKRLREWTEIPDEDYKAFHWLGLLTLEAANRIERLEAKRDELKADAMRYRWLRDNLHNTDALTELYHYADDVPTPEELDAAIDAAIAKGEK